VLLAGEAGLRRGEIIALERSDIDFKRSTLRSWMQRAQARAGLPLTSGVHILRYAFCSHLAMRGAPVRAFQELAGHADLGTAMRYVHLSPASLNQAIRLLEQRPPLRGEKGESGTPPQETRVIPTRKVASPQRFEQYKRQY
jgi:integrase